MPNDYFQFKQFTVHQGKTAMKVCTDACLFGAWIVNRLKTEGVTISNALDIGTGTGLLSLMIAQETNADITAVEIDKEAAAQAGENFNASHWRERLHIHHTDIKDLITDQLFDLIISNPPFFENDLKSTDEKRNLALHSDELKLDELISVATKLASQNGSLAILLPFHRHQQCIDAARTRGWYLSENTSVRQTEKHSAFRSMLRFTRKANAVRTLSLTIREGEEYSQGFVRFLKPFYLYL